MRDEYDVPFFYNFYRPARDQRTAAALASLDETSQGIMVLHHALVETYAKLRCARPRERGGRGAGCRQGI